MLARGGGLRDAPGGDRGNTTLSAALAAAAEAGHTAKVLDLFKQGGYPIDARTVYQSTLLHVAARHGHAELAAALLARGAAVNALDYGGMRRSPLHWACKGGHVALVELLVEAGADTKADGRCWSKLVQGQRCGGLIPQASPTESVESVCATNAVRLAVWRPRWEPSTHSMWPPRFRAAARLLLLASSYPCEDAPAGGGSSGGSGTSSGGSGGSSCTLPLSRDALQEVLRLAAYPVSAWL